MLGQHVDLPLIPTGLGEEPDLRTPGLALPKESAAIYGWLVLVKPLAPTQVLQLPPAPAFIAENHMKS